MTSVQCSNMATYTSDVMQRLSAFKFTSRSTDSVFGRIYELPKIPCPFIHDHLNPMELYDDVQFLSQYRFTNSTVRELLRMLPLAENADKRWPPLTPMVQLLVALRFYAHGYFQVVTGNLITVSQPTVSGTVNKVTGLIARHLFGSWCTSSKQRSTGKLCTPSTRLEVFLASLGASNAPMSDTRALAETLLRFFAITKEYSPSTFR
ncbi:hypothetical protein HPB48_006659 [Haemaphysalis longicornis]|uniref:Nuclease HARBI1 n=1 Tax=Haemaphysalis longicornis TaxID=44386 RepID=A0A9J6GTC4_HAELO|nr:hypothetical protein HPB48_006659 [Haemaphysalis longicornis]